MDMVRGNLTNLHNLLHLGNRHLGGETTELKTNEVQHEKKLFELTLAALHMGRLKFMAVLLNIRFPA